LYGGEGILGTHPASSAAVCTIVTLASGFDVSVTEDVETREQFERLKSLGVNFAQAI
jgi:EAL domain-containing protein (putative c-di-GMP-specific phosphodiesterase class I)